MTWPGDIDLERQAVGAAMYDPTALVAVLDRVTPADFTSPHCAATLDAIATLHHAGQRVTVESVAIELGRHGSDITRRDLASWSAGSSGFQAPMIADRIAELAACGRAVRVAHDLATAAESRDVDRVQHVLSGAEARLAAPTGRVDPPIDAADMAAEADDPDRWLVDRVLERQDRLIVTGGEGGGKSTLLAQLAVMTAAGVHWWTHRRVPPCRVLIVDLENSRRQVRSRLRTLLGTAGSQYTGGLGVAVRPQGIDLRRPADARWLDGLVAAHRADLVVVGSLYKAYRGTDRASKASEEAAEEVAAVLDQLRVRRDVALLIEAHAPHGDAGDRAGWRPAGSSLWLRWPEFGWGLKPGKDGTVGLVQWRGARDRSRLVPDGLSAGGVWPWEATWEHRMEVTA